MVGLLQFSLADLDDIRKVLLYLVKKLLANATFAVEQAIQRILIITTLLVQAAEGLFQANTSEMWGKRDRTETYRWELCEPLPATVKETSHPSWLLRRLTLNGTRCSSLIVVIRQHTHFTKLAEEFIT